MVTVLRMVAPLGVLVVLCGPVAGCSTTAGHPVSDSATSATSAVVSATASPSAAAVSPVAPPLPPSDEDQIRTAIKTFSDAANSQNWDAYLQAMCPAMRATFTPAVMDTVKKDRADHGLTTARVLSVAITGDTATAQLESTNELIGTMKVSLPLEREGTGWAVCVRP
jgi:hypothetical protein